MKKVSLKAKKEHFEKYKLMNYKASMRLEGIELNDSSVSRKSDNGLTREQVLKKYRSIK